MVNPFDTATSDAAAPDVVSAADVMDVSDADISDGMASDVGDLVTSADMDTVADWAPMDGVDSAEADSGDGVVSDQVDDGSAVTDVAADMVGDAGGCLLPAPQCVGAPSPYWTLADHQSDPPMERNISEFKGKVTVVVFLEST
jgi:hypothetical protein